MENATDRLRRLAKREGLQLRRASDQRQAYRWCGQLALFYARGGFAYASNSPDTLLAFLYHHNTIKRG